MSQMGNLEKLGILVIVILVVVVGVVVITPKETLFPELPEGEISQFPEPLDEPQTTPEGAVIDPSAPADGTDPSFLGDVPGTAGAARGGANLQGSATLRPVAPPPAEPQFREVTVQSGDSLGKIAARELGRESRWPEIVDLNAGLDPKKLRPGQKIRIPAAGATAGTSPESSAVASRSAPASTGNERIYVVQRGDTLSDICREQMGSSSKVPDLLAANQDTLKGRDTILPGMKLRIPGTRGGSATPSPARSSGSPDAAVRTYTVQKGDTLSSIASRMLGSTSRWREIANANKGVLGGGTALEPGMVLAIPGDVSAR